MLLPLTSRQSCQDIPSLFSRASEDERRHAGAQRCPPWHLQGWCPRPVHEGQAPIRGQIFIHRRTEGTVRGRPEAMLWHPVPLPCMFGHAGTVDVEHEDEVIGSRPAGSGMHSTFGDGNVDGVFAGRFRQCRTFLDTLGLFGGGVRKLPRTLPRKSAWHSHPIMDPSKEGDPTRPDSMHMWCGDGR